MITDQTNKSTTKKGVLTMETTATFNYQSTKTATGMDIANAVAGWMRSNGYEAESHKGPASTSPDDVSTVHYAHVRASEAAWAAFRNRSK